ncbi:MAG: hypothetical protein ACYC6Y_32025, partial [Thermoguttaceae bacterium]
LGRKIPLLWEHEANSALRDGKWKLVRKGEMSTGKTAAWELYDMEADRTELDDLAAEMPDRVRMMAEAWEALALHTKARPWPWGAAEPKTGKKANRQTKFELAAGAELAREDAPQTAGKSLAIEAQLLSPGEGVIVAQGGVAHGYTLYVKDGNPVFAMRHQGQLTTLTGKSPLPEGPSTVAVELRPTGEVVITVNGAEAARSPSPGPIPTPADGLTVGRDGGDPVGDYEGPQAFEGKIGKIAIRLETASTRP